MTSSMLRARAAIGALLLAGTLGFTTVAQAIAITNAGFENTTGLNEVNEFFFGQPVGWNFYDPSAIVLNNGNGPGIFTGTLQPNGVDFFNTTAPEGDLVGILFGFGTDAASAGVGEYGIEQTLGAVLEANTAYELTVEVGNITSGTGRNGDVFDLSGFPGYRVELLAGGVVIAQDDNSLVIPEAVFALSTVSFITGGAHAQLGQNLGIRLVNLNVAGATTAVDIEVDFDDVQLNATAVSAPGTLTLLALGLLAVGARKRLA